MSKILNQAKVSSKFTLLDGSINENSLTSNVSSIENMTTSFSKVRKSSHSKAISLQEVEQTLTLTNLTETNIYNVKIIDTIGNGAYFKEGSLLIDGIAYPYFLESNIILPNDILPNQSVVIEYKIVVEEDVDVSRIATISNITYSINEIENMYENSNLVYIDVVDVKLEMVKTVDKNNVIKGQILKYTHTISNTGTIKHTNLFFKDDLPLSISFQKGSIVIDGITYQEYNPDNGFELGDIDIGAQKVISFEVKVL